MMDLKLVKMFWYIFALLFSSYESLGAPVNDTVPLKNLFVTLASRCNNDFLTNQINSKIEDCSVLSSPHGEKQLQCLMFYDVNIQLCNAVADGRITLTDDYTGKLYEKQDVNTLCVATNKWTFTNISEFPRYKHLVDKVFKNPITCGKICGLDDLFSDEANDFCKYFKWGMDILQTEVPASSDKHEIDGVQTAPEHSANPDMQPVEVPSNSNDLNDLQIKNSPKSVKSEETVNVPVKEHAKTESSKPETSSIMSKNIQPIVAEKENSEKTMNNDITGLKVEDSVLVPELPSSDGEKTNVESSQPQISNPEPPKALETGPNKAAEDPTKPDIDKEIQLLNHELERKEPVLENPKVKQPSEVDDYQDSEEGKEGLGDTQGGDDGDDPLLEDVNNKVEEPKNNVKKVEETIVSTFTGEKEYYPNPIQDDFTEDGDHFFPFFLTAVILVVLLYILYHNKNKVSKVFFGLILEGRQSSRRRNSRGHSYRRLDTLEQAMSANTAAPPSKIIY